MEQTADYIQTITSIEDMPPIACDIVTTYCHALDIDEKDIYPTVWDDIIDELYFKLFKPCSRLLKTESNLYNQYDREKVLYIYKNIYRRLCNSHCQEISQKGFIDMTGIDKQTLYNWKSSDASFDLQEKIMEDNEQSLFSLTKDRRNNPIKYLAKLNKVHGWNMPGVGRASDNGANKAISARDVAQQVAALPDSSGDCIIADVDGGEDVGISSNLFQNLLQ